MRTSSFCGDDLDIPILKQVFRNEMFWEASPKFRVRVRRHGLLVEKVEPFENGAVFAGSIWTALAAGLSPNLQIWRLTVGQQFVKRPGSTCWPPRRSS